MKRCQICKTDKSINEFGNNRTKHDGKQTYCKVCSREKDKRCYAETPTRRQSVKRRRKQVLTDNRKFVFEYLLTHPCIDCGESDPIVLDFDHVVGTKHSNVSWLKRCSRSVLEHEMTKCVIRCSNCHRRKTAKQNNWYKF